MYLHIGNDKIIKKEDVLFLLDYEGLQENIIFKKFIEKIPKENKVNVSNNNPKTIVITKEKQKIKAYISNISAITLAKRNKT